MTDVFGRDLVEVDPATGAATDLAGNGAETDQSAHANAGDGGLATKATLGPTHGVSGVAFDRQGDLYITDFGNNAVRMINARTGIVTVVAGQIPTTPAHCC